MSKNTYNTVGDSEDLEKLFDTIASENNGGESSLCESEVPDAIAVQKDEHDDKVLHNIGILTRMLHDSLRDLGLNKEVEKATLSIPGARERLNYIATLTQESADKVLTATESAQPIMEKISINAEELNKQWEEVFSGNAKKENFKDLALSTQKFLKETTRDAKTTNSYLLEIIMAQDFQDLTGQVIKKVIAVTQDLEKKLVDVLLENAPDDVKKEFNAEKMNGPVIIHDEETVADQNQVDDLLASLGF